MPWFTISGSSCRIAEGCLHVTWHMSNGREREFAFPLNFWEERAIATFGKFKK